MAETEMILDGSASVDPSRPGLTRRVRFNFMSEVSCLKDGRNDSSPGTQDGAPRALGHRERPADRPVNRPRPVAPVHRVRVSAVCLTNPASVPHFSKGEWP